MKTLLGFALHASRVMVTVTKEKNFFLNEVRPETVIKLCMLKAYIRTLLGIAIRACQFKVKVSVTNK